MASLGKLFRRDMDPRLFAFFFDNLLMMLQFSYCCDYYRARLALYCGEDREDLGRMEEGGLKPGILEKPELTAEDFSFYQSHVPGVFCFLGLGDVPPLHAADFHLDEAVLERGADFDEKLLYLA